MGFGDDIGKIIGGVMNIKNAKNAEKSARKNKAQLLQAIEEQNWEPTYTSDTFVNNKTGGADFTRTDSPTARAWMESYLGGYNPQTASWSGDPNFESKTDEAQQKFDRANVTWDEAGNVLKGNAALQERERQLDKTPLYSVRAPQEPVQGDKSAGSYSGKTNDPILALGSSDKNMRYVYTGMKSPKDYTNLVIATAEANGVDTSDVSNVLEWMKTRDGRDAIHQAYLDL